jgi:UTP--glucose-1-phosphate uridylyltransferase
MIPQTGQYGNAMPLILAADEVGEESCIYAFGDDVVFGENSSIGLIDVYGRTGRPVLAAQEVDPSKKSSFGIIESRCENGVHYVTRLIEKPRADETASNLASFGRYLVTPDLMQVLKETRPGRDSEVWFVDGVIHELARQKRVCVFPLAAGTWYTVGDPRSYADAVWAAQNAPTPDFIARIV